MASNTEEIIIQLNARQMQRFTPNRYQSVFDIIRIIRRLFGRFDQRRCRSVEAFYPPVTDDSGRLWAIGSPPLASESRLLPCVCTVAFSATPISERCL